MLVERLSLNARWAAKGTNAPVRTGWVFPSYLCSVTRHDLNDEAEGPDEELGPDESDQSDEPAEAICPYCRRQISEEAQRCPHCGSYLSDEALPRRRPWWWIVAVILLLLLLLRYLMRW